MTTGRKRVSLSAFYFLFSAFGVNSRKGLRSLRSLRSLLLKVRSPKIRAHPSLVPIIGSTVGKKSPPFVLIRVKPFVSSRLRCSKIRVHLCSSVVKLSKFAVFSPRFGLFLKINGPQTPRLYWRKPQFDRLCCPATCIFQNLCQNCLVTRKNNLNL